MLAARPFPRDAGVPNQLTASPLTIPVHPLSNDQVLLLILNRLQPCCQIPDLPLNGQHIPFIRHIDDTMHIKRERLVRDMTELIAEAVGIPAGMLCSKGVGASIPTLVLKEADLLRVFQVDVYVEVTTAAYLVGEGHLV